MSFPKARVKRFNEEPGCAPAVGSYNLKILPKVPGAVFERTERFKELQRQFEASEVSKSSQKSRSSSTSSITSTPSIKMNNFKVIVAEATTSSGVSSMADLSSLKRAVALLNEQDKKQEQTIKKLQTENMALKRKITTQPNLTPLRRESLASPPTCCSSPLTKFLGLSPISKLDLSKIQENDGLKSIKIAKDNWDEREFTYQKVISSLQTALREAEEKCSKLSYQLREKPVSIVINGSPVRVKQQNKQLTPENREFMEAKHAALLKLSSAEDEIFKLKEDLKDYEAVKEKNAVLVEDAKRITNQIQQLKSQVIKEDVELKESKAFYVTLQRTFENKVKTQGEAIATLNTTIDTMKRESECQQKQIHEQEMKEEKLLQQLTSFKDATNFAKIQYEDAIHKANEDIELLTTEMGNLRAIIQEKKELEEDFKMQIHFLENEESEREGLEMELRDKITSLKSDLEDSSVTTNRLVEDEKMREELISTLHRQIEEFESQNNEITQHLIVAENIKLQSQQFQADLALISGENNHLKEQEKSLVKQIAGLNEIIKTTENGNITIKSEKLALENILSQKEMIILDLQETLVHNDQLLRLVDELKLGVCDLKLEVDKVNQQLKVEKNSANCEKLEKLDIASKLKQATFDLEQSKNNELTLAIEIGTLRRDLHGVIESGHKLEVENTRLEECIVKSETEMSELRKEVTDLKENHVDTQRLQMENQVLKKQLDDQLMEEAKKQEENDVKLKDLWNRLIAKKNLVNAQNAEMEELKKDRNNIKETAKDEQKWKDLYEELKDKVSPFMEQLDMYAHERSFLVKETDLALKERETLEQKYAKLMGHANHRQKIQYLCKLQEELSDLRKENAKLKETNYKQHLTLQKQQLEPVVSAKKSSAKKTAKPLKENAQAAFF